MALARVQASPKTYNSGSSIAITLSTPPTVGNGLIVLLNFWRGGASSAVPSTCVDNRGNGYTLAISRTNANAVTGVFVCATVATSGAPFTLTVTATATADWVVQVLEVSGVGAGLLVDQSVGATGTSSTPATGAAPALTAAETFQVAIHAIANAQTSITIAAGTPAWAQEFEELSSALIAGEAVSRLVPSGLGTTPSASWTDVTAAVWSAVLVAVKAPGAPAAVARVSSYVLLPV